MAQATETLDGARSDGAVSAGGAPVALDGSAGAVIPPEGDIQTGVLHQLLDFLDTGGPILYILAALSILAMTIVLSKLLQFRGAGAGSPRHVDAVVAAWAKGAPEEAATRLRKLRGPMARVLRVAVAALAAPGADRDLAREEITRVAVAEIAQLRGGLRLLAMIASISPLLGLLGTVIGMINAFQALEGAGNRVDPSILSGGIWVALLTTAAGLAVAIPAAVAHGWFEGRVDAIARRLEDAVTRLVTSRLANPKPRLEQVEYAAD